MPLPLIILQKPGNPDVLVSPATPSATKRAERGRPSNQSAGGRYSLALKASGTHQNILFQDVLVPFSGHPFIQDTFILDSRGKLVENIAIGYSKRKSWLKTLKHG